MTTSARTWICNPCGKTYSYAKSDLPDEGVMPPRCPSHPDQPMSLLRSDPRICECGHREDEHTGADGCTRQRPAGVGHTEICYCRAFSARQATPEAPSASATSPEAPATPHVNLAHRERMPDERASVTRVFRLPYTHKTGEPDVMHLYFTAGFYADGRVGEVFVRADRAGTLARGTLDALATMVSIMLQYSIPVEKIVEKLRHHRFPPDGRLLYADGADPGFRTCTSVVDLLAQWLEKKCPGKTS